MVAFLDHLKRFAITYLVIFALLGVVFLYYQYQWKTFADFVIAIDHHPQFMQDFVGFYYPMGRKILEDPTPILAYYYTAFFAVAISPICQLELPGAMLVWGAIQMLCVLIIVVVPIRLLELSRWKIVLYAFLCVTSFPILHNFKWGQVSILVLACVLAALLAHKRKLRVLAGTLIAFAAAIKLYPAIFIVYFIVKKDMRACTSFVVAALIFYVALPVALLSFSGWYDFEAAVFTAISEARWVARDVNSQHFVHVCTRWWSELFEQAPEENVSFVLSIIGYAVAASCIAWSWLLGRKDPGERSRLQSIPIFLAIPFVAKTSWPHYFVFLPFCQMSVFSYYASFMKRVAPLKRVVIALPVASILLSSIFLFNQFPERKVYASYGVLFASHLLLLISVYAALFLRARDPEK